MTTETIIPKDEAHWLALRKEDVTSTEAAALFGISPYLTNFELWHRKHDNLEVDFKMNERMAWGTRLEGAIAAGVAEDNHWAIRKMSEYMRDPLLRMGASFDFEFDASEYPEKIGILEVKNVDSLAFRDGWLVDGDNVEAPPHIEIQVQQQLALSGKSVAYIAALIGGNRVVLIKREPDPAVIFAIKTKIQQFWTSIIENVPPKPDFQRDAAFIAKLYRFAEPGKVMLAEDDQTLFELAKEYRALGEQKKLAEEGQEGIKAQMLMRCGDAEKVTGSGFSLSLGMVGPAHIEYDRQPYRTFRVNWKKEKAK